jgi:hypothetical protein
MLPYDVKREHEKPSSECEAVFIRDMLHQFPTVHADMDVEGKSCLYLHKQETAFPVQTVEAAVKT